MGILRMIYPILRRNLTYVPTVIIGGLGFGYVFDRTTTYVFYDVINKGRGFKYYEPKLLEIKARLAAAEEEEEEDDE